MSKKRNETVCGVVVTFNRKALLKNCLNALTEQTRPLDAILIVDNASTDNTSQDLLDMGYIQKLPPDKISEPYEIEFVSKIKNLEGGYVKVIYILMSENTGGAGGFHMGQKRAFDLGYDWIWLMDDDGYPDSKALEKLMEYSGLDNVAALNCLVVSNKNEENLAFQMPYITPDGDVTKFKNKRYTKSIAELTDYFGGAVYEWGNLFNGTMLKSSIVSKVGDINKKMFIWGDEQDYFYRLRFEGKVYTVMSSRHYHPDDNKANPPLWKKYYGFRNELYLNRKYRNFKVFRFFWSIARAFPLFCREENGLRGYLKAIYESFKL